MECVEQLRGVCCSRCVHQGAMPSHTTKSPAAKQVSVLHWCMQCMYQGGSCTGPWQNSLCLIARVLQRPVSSMATFHDGQCVSERLAGPAPQGPLKLSGLTRLFLTRSRECVWSRERMQVSDIGRVACPRHDYTHQRLLAIGVHALLHEDLAVEPCTSGRVLFACPYRRLEVGLLQHGELTMHATAALHFAGSCSHLRLAPMHITVPPPLQPHLMQGALQTPQDTFDPSAEVRQGSFSHPPGPPPPYESVVGASAAGQPAAAADSTPQISLPPPLPPQPSDFEITVADPVKQGEGVSAYVSYKVSIRVFCAPLGVVLLLLLHRGQGGTTP